MPRAIWSGSISFGLVSVPVRMFSAVEEHKLHFHFVHAPDGSRIGYDTICKAEEKPVPEEEIVKAFEYEKGEYVYLTDEDFEAAQVEGGRTIDIQAFVPTTRSTRSSSSEPTTWRRPRTGRRSMRFWRAR
jgi:DNA end-binding protein Ku